MLDVHAPLAADRSISERAMPSAGVTPMPPTRQTSGRGS